MIILHLSPTDIRYDSRILKELQSLENLDDCKVIAYGIDDDEGHLYGANQSANIRTFKLLSKTFLFLPRPIRYFLNLLEAMFRLTIPAIRTKPAIVHCHDTLFLPIALIIRMVCKSKIIYDAHELESNKAAQSAILSKYTLFIEKLAWKKIDLLISVSPSIIEWYNTHLGKKESLLILNSPLFKKGNTKETKSNYLREKFDIPVESKIFLYVGFLNIGRGVEMFLDIFKRESIESHIVFLGYGNLAGEVESIAARYPNIHYHPSVPHHQVVEISSSADVGLCMIEAVSLSDYYCLPNKLFEYAFSGLYVLCSDFPDMKEIVEKYALGKTTGLEREEVFKSIKSIETTEIYNNNVANHVDLYPLSWNYQSEQLIKQYQSLILNKIKI
jgi:glycosyltransferase involved in cell wall biosynthesis